MNKFIAFLVIVIPILAMFLQDVNQEKNMHYKDSAETIIAVACEQAKAEGYFTPEIISEMKRSFDKVGIDSSRVEIDVTTTPKYRMDEYDSRELINYRIGIPIDTIIAANEVWGISDEANKYAKIYSGKVASEKLNV